MKNIDLSDFKNSKIAFVCSGGVVKAGSWHLGVALALEELGFTFKSNKNTRKEEKELSKSLEISTFVGASAGSMVGLYLAAGFSPQDVIQATLGTNKKKLKPVSYKEILYLKRPLKRPKRSELSGIFESFPTLLKQVLSPLSNFNGLFSTEGLCLYLKEHVLNGSHFEDYEADIFVVATQLDHSRKVIFSKYNYPNPRHDSTAVYYTEIPVAEACAASMSVPPFYSPYPVKNPQTNQIDYYLDGEIRETLSTHVAEDNGCDLIISSWTHTPYHYQDEIGSLINYGLPAICLQSIYLLIQKKIVASRARRIANIEIINTVNDYMKKEKFSTRHRKGILSILERKLNTNPNIKLIDIYPKHQNYNIFFTNSFSPGTLGNNEVFQMDTWPFQVEYLGYIRAIPKISSSHSATKQ